MGSDREGGQPAALQVVGRRAGRVIPYASQLRLSTVEERVTQTERLKAEGWKAIKLRNRFPTVKEDIRLVEQIRKAVGDEFIIATDANQANPASTNFLQSGTKWDFERAVKCARAYQEMNVFWLEEPLPRYDIDHIAELNKLVEIKIAGGEANHGLHEFRALLDRGAYDIIQPEIMTEGPTLMRKAAVLAESMGKLCIPHVGNQLGNICSMHLVAAWPNAPIFEIFNDPPASEMKFSNAIYENPPVFKDGYLTMPDGPGLGVTIRKDLRRPASFAIEHPTLINLGFEWHIDGDANRNAKASTFPSGSKARPPGARPCRWRASTANRCSSGTCSISSRRTCLPAASWIWSRTRRMRRGSSLPIPTA